MALSTNWISNYGIFVKNSEEKLKHILNVKHCILMNNGTAATHCLLLAIKHKYPEIKKIYVPNNVFFIIIYNTIYITLPYDFI